MSYVMHTSKLLSKSANEARANFNLDSRSSLPLSTDGLCEMLNIAVEKGLPRGTVLKIPRHELYPVRVLHVSIDVGLIDEAVNAPNWAFLLAVGF